MLKEGADKAYIVYIPGFRGFVSTRFTANPNDWRDHVVFNSNLADIQSVSVEFGADPQRIPHRQCWQAPIYDDAFG